jgi:uncharacterized protein YfaS (alpha-2-macroglobulin family)
MKEVDQQEGQEPFVSNRSPMPLRVEEELILVSRSLHLHLDQAPPLRLPHLRSQNLELFFLQIIELSQSNEDSIKGMRQMVEQVNNLGDILFE